MSTDHKTESVQRAHRAASGEPTDWPSSLADALVAEGWTPPPEPPPSPIVVSDDAIGHLEGVADECVPLDQMRRVAKLLFKVMLRDSLKAMPADYDGSLWAAYAPGFYVHRPHLYRALTGEEWPG